jgi:hypothetical protein
MKHPLVILGILLGVGLGLSACDKEQSLTEKQQAVENGNLDDALTYTVAEVGWSTQLPAGWDVMTPETAQKLQTQGQKAVEKAAEAQVDVSALKQLLNLRKDPFNILLSTMEPYDEAADGPWLEANKEVLDLMARSYAEAGVKLGQTKLGVETLDGLEFQTWQAEMLDPSGQSVLIVQKMYSRLIHGYDFAITVTTNNEPDREAMTKLLRSSKFSLRD